MQIETVRSLTAHNPNMSCSEIIDMNAPKGHVLTCRDGVMEIVKPSDIPVRIIYKLCNEVYLYETCPNMSHGLIDVWLSMTTSERNDYEYNTFVMLISKLSYVELLFEDVLERVPRSNTMMWEMCARYYPSEELTMYALKHHMWHVVGCLNNKLYNFTRDTYTRSNGYVRKALRDMHLSPEDVFDLINCPYVSDPERKMLCDGCWRDEWTKY